MISCWESWGTLQEMARISPVWWRMETPRVGTSLVESLKDSLPEEECIFLSKDNRKIHFR